MNACWIGIWFVEQSSELNSFSHCYLVLFSSIFFRFDKFPHDTDANWHKSFARHLTCNKFDVDAYVSYIYGSDSGFSSKVADSKV